MRSVSRSSTAPLIYDVPRSIPIKLTIYPRLQTQCSGFRSKISLTSLPVAERQLNLPSASGQYPAIAGTRDKQEALVDPFLSIGPSSKARNLACFLASCQHAHYRLTVGYGAVFDAHRPG